MTILQKSKNKTIAIVPFFNEKESLPLLTSSLLAYVDQVIFIDDCSDDGGSLVIPKSEKIILLKNDKNSGKGFSLKRGFKRAIDSGAEVFITIDSDLQHPPEHIPGLLTELETCDIVIANRINRKTMPFHRKLSNYLTSKLLSLKLGTEIKDSQCGFRAFRVNSIKNISWRRNDFLAETEIIINAVRCGLLVGFVNIPTIYNSNNSKMKHFATTIGFIKLILSNSKEN
ncbi:MAG: glycosyltransferase family 2 protein [Melioribacteraceae bacterium]|nr:glycosyltransferase family 2 protein [Melioribacteraceae bacterium]MCF8265077.1 glycosyltransferase family 2 protein [Melioribacteraceae bacterium]